MIASKITYKTKRKLDFAKIANFRRFTIGDLGRSRNHLRAANRAPHFRSGLEPVRSTKAQVIGMSIRLEANLLALLIGLAAMVSIYLAIDRPTQGTEPRPTDAYIEQPAQSPLPWLPLHAI